MNFKVISKAGLEYDCYQFIMSGDGKVYGICYHKGDNNFMLIPYDGIKPVDGRTLNEGNTNETMKVRSGFLKKNW